ncbi:heavy metal translocating P-type ATPase [Naasia sp. SYSU D00057]|uniref:heavy metal translocating P-type ATPase n=1 Tax=Naasia sp. SYSU D00057 TaxID=2817380 RepID=UPI001B303DB2
MHDSAAHEYAGHDRAVDSDHAHPGHDHAAHALAEHEHAGHVPHAEHDHSAHGAHAHAGHAHGDHGGHGGHGDHAALFRNRFWVSLVLAIPVVAFSPMFAEILGYPAPSFPGAEWISPLLGTVVFLYGGWPFLTGLVAEVRVRQPGMMTLIAMAITVAFVASWVTSLGLSDLDLDFWWELALLIVIMLLGHWLEMRALGAASSALDALAALLPDRAIRVDGPVGLTEVPLGELRVGDLVLVRSGARVPADGTVVDGTAEFDESMITGESRTVARGAGDRVTAGTVATDSAVRVRVDAVGADTALAGIQRLVADAQRSSSRAQALADRAAALLFYFAAGAGVLTFAVWLLLGSPADAIERTVTVLVIACPHALGLAIPLVIAISTERAARAGVLVKSRLALERMRTVDTVLFDKTGTLTRGEPVVTDVAVAPGVARDKALAIAAALERSSEHPVARALVRAAEEAELDAGIEVTDFRSLTARGVEGRIAGELVRVGGPALLREEDVAVPSELDEPVAAWSGEGAAVLYLVQAGRARAAFAVRDEVRPESREVVDALHRRGVRVAMITGDARAVAESVGAELGIDEVFAEVRPEDKDAKVAELQSRGAKVAMVGDGVNDAPALARADVGIAIGAGTDVAIESAGVVLAGNDPRSVLTVIELSRSGYRKMVQNLAWATGYNVLSVPLAAGVLAGAGFVLSPAAGAILMSVSTIVVALNAQLLRRVRLRPEELAQP